eukprot:scaffold218707_cov43-Attheya_sp.AAC.2
MCAIDAAPSSGWNPRIIFIGIRDLPADLSPLLCQVHRLNLDMDGLSRYGWFLLFKRWYFSWNWMTGCRYTVSTLLHDVGAVSWSVYGLT